MAFANPHWRTIKDDAPALAVVAGPDAYISPSWYATKAEHGRVMLTWNYSAIRRALARHRRPRVAQQLKAVVGIEFSITAIEAKAKRSQNRSAEDRSGVIAGLLAEPGADSHMLASQMQADL